MADFIPYQTRVERSVNPDKTVRLSPDRWQSLVDYIRANYGDQHPEENITVYEATEVNGLLFLPAVYRAA